MLGLLMTSESTIVVLGDEYDECLRETLKAVLVDINADHGASRWGVGGSQEIDRVELRIDGEPLVVEAETYIGLTISGDRALTARVKSLVEAKLAMLRPNRGTT